MLAQEFTAVFQDIRECRKPRTGYEQDLTNDSTHAMLTSYALVLLAIAGDPGIRVSDIAGTLGISQRRVYNVISELLEQSLLSVSRERHRKVYAINRDAEMSVPILGRMTLGELLNVLAPLHR
jgi:hypothetical protein